MELKSVRKVAALLLSIDDGTAAEVLKHVPEEKITDVIREMAAIGAVDHDTAEHVLTEFGQIAEADGALLGGSRASVADILKKALGPSRAEELLAIIGLEDSGGTPFQALQDLSAEELKGLLGGEHPQTIAVVLSHLSSKHAAGALGLLPEELQFDVIYRMTTTDQTSVEMLQKVDAIIRTKRRFLGQRRKTPVEERLKAVADILNSGSKDVEKHVLDGLAEREPELAQEVRELMFVFDDIAYLSDEAVRKVLMQLDMQMVALALKTAGPPVKDKILGNLSKRARESLNEELELMGLRPVSQVEAAQRQISETIRQLASEGEITVREAKQESEQMV